MSGREKINAFVHKSIEPIADVQTEQFLHVLATRNPLALIKAGLLFFQGLINKPYPLQALLFSDKQEIERIGSIVDAFKPDAVFIESVRSIFLIQALRQRWPKLRIVCDFDDLMSRRMAEWSRHGNAISFGYITRFIPSPLQKLLTGPFAGIICRYEKKALERLELACFKDTDRIVLLSSTEYRILKGRLSIAQKSKLCLIPPAFNIPQHLHIPKEPVRFVFIGSDSLLQNKLTINFLVAQWQKKHPITPLVIYGKMVHQYPAVPNLSFAGFADSLDDVYTPNSVLLAPAFVKGGIKTKVIEALEHGILVAGNDITWDGILDKPSPLTMDADRLALFIANPQEHLDNLIIKNQEVVEHLKIYQSIAATSSKWRSTILRNP